MALAIIHSRAVLGVDAPAVAVEVHVAGGLPGMTLVGLPATAVREARDRVRAALQNSGYTVPPRRITVNLAPADLPKDGGRYDLAIALGILRATGQLDADLDRFEFVGELSLSGELRPARGVLPAALACAAAGRGLVVSAGNAAEAALAAGLEVRAAASLDAVCAWLQGGAALPRAAPRPPAPGAPAPDLLEVRGQGAAKRALEIAAAGGHSLLLCGPPGCGKSMLARRLPALLPPLSTGEALEVAAIHSVAHGRLPENWGMRPFRTPHHSASAAALCGGGSSPRPGEITLAHHGVLFLDELPEFSRAVLEVLREPLEAGRILISRANRQAEFPACFQLLAAMNPCPCGLLGEPGGQCHCSPEQVRRYRQRLSGPLLDRIDIQLRVTPTPREALFGDGPDGEASAVVRDRVEAARALQLQRQGTVNAALPARVRDQVCRLSPQAATLLAAAMTRLRLSARAVHRIQALARTIADLAASDCIDTAHIAEAIQYRQFDRREAGGLAG